MYIELPLCLHDDWSWGLKPNPMEYATLSQAINGLREQGYTEDFNLRGDCIQCLAHALELSPEDFEIDKVFRFEGASDPDDNSILFAISSKDETLKGVLVDAYGTYADPLTTEMIKKLRTN